MRLPEWSQYIEMPLGSKTSARLDETAKITLLKKLGLDAGADKQRSSFLHSRRLKG